MDAAVVGLCLGLVPLASAVWLAGQLSGPAYLGVLGLLSGAWLFWRGARARLCRRHARAEQVRLFPEVWYPVNHTERRTFIRTEVRLRLAVADRLRLLLTAGNMRLLVTTYTDVEVKSCTAHFNVEVQPWH